MQRAAWRLPARRCRALVKGPRGAVAAPAAAPAAALAAVPAARAPRAPWSRALATAVVAGDATPVVVVDGASATPPEQLAQDIADAARADGVHVLAIGQRGTLAALAAAARVEEGGRRPTFTLERMSADAVQAHQLHITLWGHNHYRLALPAASAWEAEEVRRQRHVGARLLVGNTTDVMPLAKAIAARTKFMPDGECLAVETALQGKAQPSRLRISRLAHALARAYHWQVAPEDASRPTRVFRCAASLVEGDSAAAGAEGTPGASRDGGPGGAAARGPGFIRVEVLPQGPVGGTVPGSG